MKGKRFNESQIIKALKSHEAGAKVSDICRELGIVEQTFYRWRAKYGGMGLSEMKRMKSLETENSKLKKLVAELMMDRIDLKEVLSKKW